MNEDKEIIWYYLGFLSMFILSVWKILDIVLWATVKLFPECPIK